MMLGTWLGVSLQRWKRQIEKAAAKQAKEDVRAEFQREFGSARVPPAERVMWAHGLLDRLRDEEWGADSDLVDEAGEFGNQLYQMAVAAELCRIVVRYTSLTPKIERTTLSLITPR